MSSTAARKVSADLISNGLKLWRQTGSGSGHMVSMSRSMSTRVTAHQPLRMSFSLADHHHRHKNVLKSVKIPAVRHLDVETVNCPWPATDLESASAANVSPDVQTKVEMNSGEYSVTVYNVSSRSLSEISVCVESHRVLAVHIETEQKVEEGLRTSNVLSRQFPLPERVDSRELRAEFCPQKKILRIKAPLPKELITPDIPIPMV